MRSTSISPLLPSFICKLNLPVANINNIKRGQRFPAGGDQAVTGGGGEAGSLG